MNVVFINSLRLKIKADINKLIFIFFKQKISKLLIALFVFF